MEFETYRSPFSFRYGSAEMRRLWSEQEKRRIWRRIWLALAETEAEFNLIPTNALADIQTHVDDIDIERALEIESEIHHDLMAELRTFAEQCPTGGGNLHMGATSMDIEDNADALRIRQALDLLLPRLQALLLSLAEQVERQADLPVMAFTHLQPAEPTTLGYRLSTYAQDLLEDYHALVGRRNQIRGKGFKGAVGTGAAYGELVGVERLGPFEASLSARLKLPFYPVTTQTSPRKQEYTLLCALAGLGQSLYKFAFDLRLLQSPPLGEWSEPFGKKQVGSSAMPFKRNPIQAEKIDSLARTLAQMPVTAWHNAAHSLLERTLDDSANRRTLLPEAFLTCDELLITAEKMIKGLVINEEAIQRNLEMYAPFAATERVLMAVAKRGADRQEMHERIRQHALQAWAAVQQGQPNPLLTLLMYDDLIARWLKVEELRPLCEVKGYLGLAPAHARQMAGRIRAELGEASHRNG